MGKGTITGGGTSGQYTVELNFNTSSYNARMNALNENISWVGAEIVKVENDETMPEAEKAFKISVLNLQKNSFELRKSFLSRNAIKDYEVSAWCADLTEDLSGVVATIEVPGETTSVMVAPKGADWDSNDGQLMSTITMDSAGAYYNLALLPYWQKFKPTFRYAIISNIDTFLHTATITLEPATSSQQNIDINKTSIFYDVPINYMDCNSYPFEQGDGVLVSFDNDPDNPTVIGFKDNPKPCYWLLRFSSLIDMQASYVSYPPVFDVEDNTYYLHTYGGVSPYGYASCAGEAVTNYTLPNPRSAYCFILMNCKVNSITEQGNGGGFYLQMEYEMVSGGPDRYVWFRVERYNGESFATGGKRGYYWKLPTNEQGGMKKVISARLYSGAYGVGSDVAVTSFQVGLSTSPRTGFTNIPFAWGMYI